ncbi:MAG: ECF transporter S component [Propionibacteriaceae bacterium]|jgi:energy-coupling factor transport system substrate-specific component|nr:ECF transporter S component [Propionibacteriaceae bacterium]
MVRVGWRSALLLAIVTIAGAGMFAWPLFIPTQGGDTGGQAPFIFIALLPMLIFLVLAQLSEKGMDTKTLAILGVLSAINAVLRPLGAGTNGFETVFFLLILAGRVFGPGFGFVLGCTSIFASALLTAGVGPWLPFQMLAAAWIGMGAGLLPRRAFGRLIAGKVEVVMLIVYGILVAYLYGAVMNLWFWPFVTGPAMGEGTDLSYIPGGPLLENLRRFLAFTLITSTAVWDTGRAIANTVMLALVGAPVLAALRRTQKQSNFTPNPVFDLPTPVFDPPTPVAPLPTPTP